MNFGRMSASARRLSQGVAPALARAIRTPASVRVANVSRAFSVTAMRQASSYEKNVTKMEGDVAPVNLYDGHYADHMQEAQTKVRTYTYGEGEGLDHVCVHLDFSLRIFANVCVRSMRV